MVKKKFKYFADYKEAEIDLYAYFSQRWVHTERTLMKLNIYIYFNTRWWIIRKTQWNLGKRLKYSQKRI